MCALWLDVTRKLASWSVWAATSPTWSDALYTESEFQEFHWYGKTSRPAEHRYNLPLMSGVTATQVTEA